MAKKKKSSKKKNPSPIDLFTEMLVDVARMGFQGFIATHKNPTYKMSYAQGFADATETLLNIHRMSQQAKSKKEIQWGHVWKTKGEDFKEAVEMFWGSMGHGWTIKDCHADIKRAVNEKSISKKHKTEVYRVVLQKVEG